MATSTVASHDARRQILLHMLIMLNDMVKLDPQEIKTCLTLVDKIGDPKLETSKIEVEVASWWSLQFQGFPQLVDGPNRKLTALTIRLFAGVDTWAGITIYCRQLRQDPSDPQKAYTAFLQSTNVTVLARKWRHELFSYLSQHPECNEALINLLSAHAEILISRNVAAMLMDELENMRLTQLKQLDGRYIGDDFKEFNQDLATALAPEPDSKFLHALESPQFRHFGTGSL